MPDELLTPVPGFTPGEDTKARRARRDRRARRRRAFGFGILATFTSVMLIVTAGVFLGAGVFVHYTAKSALEDELARRLEAIARLSADAQSRRLLQLVRGNNPEATKQVRDTLRRLRAHTGVRDILILTPELRVLVRAADDPRADRAEEEALASDAATIHRALESVHPVTSKLYYYKAPLEERGRYYRAAYIAIDLDAKGLQGNEEEKLVLAVDLPADIAQAVDRVDTNFFLVGALAAFVVFVSAVLIVRRYVHVPIYRLVRAMEGDGIEPGPPVVARIRRHDEIGTLTEHYNKMVERLAGQEAELRQLYAEMRDRAAFLKSYSNYLVEGVPTGVVAVDPNGFVTVWNEGAARILARRAIETVGRPKEAALGQEHPVARALTAALGGSVSDQAIVAIGQAGDAEAGEADQEDAGARLVELAAAPIRDERGGLLGAAALFNDRTELERLRRTATRHERLAAVGRLAAGLAHEIRNPLGAISGFAELLERQQKKEGEASRLAQRLRGEVDELNRFVTEFLAFARDSQIKRAPSELNLLVERACETALAAVGVEAQDLRRALKGEPIRVAPKTVAGEPPAEPTGELRVVLELDPALETFPVDPIALRSALVNIVKNAFEAMHLSGVVTVRTRRQDDRAILRIKDTGPGIPAELREKIFDPFFTTKEKGVGLGLAIAHKVVTAHGGRIQLRAPEAGGTEFVIRLPTEGQAGSQEGDESERSGERRAAGSDRVQKDDAPTPVGAARIVAPADAKDATPPGDELRHAAR